MARQAACTKYIIFVTCCMSEAWLCQSATGMICEGVDLQGDPGRQRTVNGDEVIVEPVVLVASRPVVGIGAQENVVGGANVDLRGSSCQASRLPNMRCNACMQGAGMKLQYACAELAGPRMLQV